MPWNAAYNLLRDAVGSLRRRSNQPKLAIVESEVVVTTEGESVVGKDSDLITHVTYRVKIRNIGKRTAHGCKPSIYFHANRRPHWNVEMIDGERSVDTPVCWPNSYGMSRNLRPEETAWLDVVRLTEDYSSDEPFTFEEGVYIEFPTEDHWKEVGMVRFAHPGEGFSYTSENIPFPMMKDLWWDEARLTVQCDETTLRASLSMEDISEKMMYEELFSGSLDESTAQVEEESDKSNPSDKNT